MDAIISRFQNLTLPSLREILIITISLFSIIIVTKIVMYIRPGVGYFSYMFNKIMYSDKRKNYMCPRCKRVRTKKSDFHPWCSRKCKREAEKESRQVFKHDNRCEKHPFQRLTFRNYCFDCYVHEWQNVNSRTSSVKGCSGLVFKHGFKWFPTLRTSTDSWGGDKAAFDMLLSKRGYKWIVYIKLYRDHKGTIRPLVVGKSGSTKVNSSGCDLNFSTAVEDGAARKFLAKNGYCWYYRYILVKKCYTQKSAYIFERKIMKKYHLYGG